MPSGRVEDFCFRLLFSVLLIIFDFFYAVTEPVWMESVFKGSGLAHDKIFAENTLQLKDAREIFRKTDLSARFCKSVDSDYKESDIQQMLGKAYRPLLDNQNLV